MKKRSLRTRYLHVTSSALAALALPGLAAAHVDVRPTFGELGAVTELRVELPRLRPGPAPVGLEVEAEDAEVLSTRLEGELGAETVWRVRVRPTGEPGRRQLVLRARFADGESVEVDASFTGVPPPPGPSFPWPAVAGGTAAVGLAAGLFVAARRRRG